MGTGANVPCGFRVGLVGSLMANVIIHFRPPAHGASFGVPSRTINIDPATERAAKVLVRILSGAPSAESENCYSVAKQMIEAYFVTPGAA